MCVLIHSWQPADGSVLYILYDETADVLHLSEFFVQICELLAGFYLAFMGVWVPEESKVVHYGRKFAI